MLHKLWLFCFAAILLATLWRFSGCARSTPATEKSPPPRKKSAPAAQTPPRRQSAPQYTYVGEKKPAAPPQRQHAQDAGNAPPEHPAVQIASAEKARHGHIPDLDIRLAGNDITRVIAHYGFLPAVKSRTRLLGKIVDGRFLPISAKELESYARRGRAGHSFPDATAWLARISRELGIPSHQLSLVLLVPHTTEAYFIDCQRRALAKAGQQPQNVSLMRAHYNTDLEVIVDELVLRSGDVLTGN